MRHEGHDGAAGRGAPVLLKPLRRRLTLIFTALTGSVLIAMLLLTLMLAQQQARTAARGRLTDIANTLIEQLRSGGTVSDDWLARTEAASRLVIGIADRGHPLFFSGSWSPATDRETLLERARQEAEALGLPLGEAPASSLYAARQQFELVGDSGDRYLAEAALIPADGGWYSLILLQDTRPLQGVLLRLRLLYGGIGAAGVVLLLAVSWFLSGRVLRPTAESIQKQRDFVAAASHELRSPLAVIRTSLSAIPADPAREARYLKNIEGEARRMSRLVDDLLILAGSDAKSWKLRMEPVDLDALLIDAFDQFEPLARAKGIALRPLLPEAPVGAADGDRGRLMQVLSVLLSNAADYAPPGSAVTLEARRGKTRALITVSDQGPGVPDREKERIFDRFYRADAARSGKSHFGLGLSVARELAALHGGTLTVRDAPGGGAAFTLSLPLR